MGKKFFFVSNLFFWLPLLWLSSLLMSCNGSNVDSASEISCSTADGLWTRTSVTCNGAGLSDLPPVTYFFNRDTGAVQETLGRVDCATTRNWNVEIGSETAIFSMRGEGTYTCTRSGVEVPSCSTENVNSCNASINWAGIRSEYPTCVITNQGMQLFRTVSVVNNPDGVSLCGDGQEEVVTLIQGEYTPPPPEQDPEATRAFLAVDGTNPYDFGTHPVGDRIQQTITIRNTGNATATGVVGTGLGNPYLFAGGSFPGDGGDCGGSLAAGASCTMEIEFFSLVQGYYTDNIIITYNNGERGVNLNLGLAGTASNGLALLAISQGPFHDYGNVTVITSATQSFTITNTGGGDALALDGAGLEAPYDFTGGGGFPGAGGTCGASLPAGDTCTFEVDFSPVAEGTFNDSIEINYLDGINNQQATRNVFGVGIP